MRGTQLAGLLCLLLLCAHAIAPTGHAAIPAHAQPNTAIAPDRTVASPSCSNNSTIGSKIWTLAISDTLAFLGDGQALTILDISAAARPVCRSHLALPTNSAVTAIEVRGSYAYLVLGSTSAQDVALQIVDVHDPDNPVL